MAASFILSYIITILVLAFYIAYEAYYDFKFKRYTCNKCGMVIILPRDEKITVDHVCDRITNATRIHKD